MSVSGVGTTSTDTSLVYLLQSYETSQTNQSSQASQTGETQSIGAILAGMVGGSVATTSSTSVSGVAGDSATISGPGQLFSQLQQLQSQDPTAFKQVTATIASQLQSASQQVTGNQSTFLSNLATQFETASTTGSAAPLQPHHHSHAQGTYNSQGQVSVPPALSASTTSGTDLGQLFSTISKEVTQAIGA